MHKLLTRSNITKRIILTHSQDYSERLQKLFFAISDTSREHTTDTDDTDARREDIEPN